MNIEAVNLIKMDTLIYGVSYELFLVPGLWALVTGYRFLVTGHRLLAPSSE